MLRLGADRARSRLPARSPSPDDRTPIMCGRRQLGLLHESVTTRPTSATAV